MPYKSNSDLPDSVKNVLPSGAQEIFRKAFNSAVAQYDGDEETAMKVAWSAVKKSGYKKKDDKWIKEGEEESENNLDELEEMSIGFNVVSFDQLEAQEKAVERAKDIERLTYAFTEMIENIMYLDEIEDKIGAINMLTEQFTSRLSMMQEAEQRRAISENDGDKVELSENEESPITTISESDVGPLHAIVRIIRPGWGNQRNNHYYPKDVLSRDAYRFIGAKMYETDHKQNEKSTRTWVSTIEDIVGFDENGAPLAKVAVHDSSFAERLKNLNSLGMLEKMECSIYANGLAKPGFKMNGREGKQVESITGVSSVDWVTKAGAGGAAVSLMENESNEENIMPEIVEEQEVEEEQAETIQEVEIQEQDKPVEFLEVDAIKDILKETKLPDYAQKRLAYSGRFKTKEEVIEAANAEIQYLKEVTGAGKPFGMAARPQPQIAESSVDKLAELEKAKNQHIKDFMKQ